MELKKLIRKMLTESYTPVTHLEFNTHHYKAMVHKFLHMEPMASYVDAVIFSYYSEDFVDDEEVVRQHYVPHIYLVGTMNYEATELMWERFHSFLDYFGLPDFSVSFDTWDNFMDDQTRISKGGLKRPYYEIEYGGKERGVALERLVRHIRFFNDRNLKGDD